MSSHPIDPAAGGKLALDALGVPCIPSDTSFVLARLGEGGHEALRRAGIAVRRADTRAVAVNWFPYTGIKASLSYQQTKFAAGAAAGDRPDERVLLARLQLYF